MRRTNDCYVSLHLLRYLNYISSHVELSLAPLASMMSIHTEKEPHRYNIVITGNHLISMHYNPVSDLKLVNWVLSKYVLISGYDDDMRFVWMEHQEDGVTLYSTNNSGTYLPNNEHLAAAGRFISAAFPGLKLQLHFLARLMINL